MLVDTRMAGENKYYLTPRKDINMRVPDEIHKCVVFVGVNVPSGNGGEDTLSYGGTAFIVALRMDPSTRFTYLVTAKHVADAIEGKDFWVRANTKDGGSQIISGRGVHWWKHPTDAAADVAVFPWSPPDDLDVERVMVPSVLTPEMMRDKNIGIGDEVFITGLFSFALGKDRNMPIVRTGNIAMIPEDKIETGYGDADIYLVEVRSIGGISGSPVFVRQTVFLDVHVKSNPQEKSPLIGLGKYYLLGLVHGHWDIHEKDMNAPSSPVAPKGAGVNLGIANVVPAHKILETLNHPELVAMREQKMIEKNSQEQRERMPTPDVDFPPVEQPSSEGDFTREDFENALKKVSRRVTPSPPDQETP